MQKPMRLTRRSLLGAAASASALPAAPHAFAQRALITDTIARPVGAAPKPPYLIPMFDPVFGTKVTRISDDPGNVMSNIPGGIWGQCVRHHYSLDQAWNADQSLLYLDSNADPDSLPLIGVTGAAANTGYPKSHLFLDGQTYLPKFHRPPPGGNNADIRWHVSEPSRMYYVHDAEFGLWNPVDNTTEVIQTFSGYSRLLFGKYKGIQSHDGDYFVFMGKDLSGSDCVFAYRVSTGVKFLDIVSSVNSAQISPLGNYIIAVNGDDDTLVYTLNGALVQTWTAPLAGAGSPSHADVTVDDKGDEVMFGVGKVNYAGSLVKRRIADGAYTRLTVASPPNYGQHCSARNTLLPGWGFASAPDNGASYPLYSEMVIAVKLDGSKVVQLCHTRATNIQDNYYSAAAASPSPTGDRVIFGSSWGDPNGNGRPVQAYVCDLRGGPGLPT